MNLRNHPTVIAHRARRELEVSTILDAANLRERCMAAGADDVGFVDIANPALDDQRGIF